MDGNSALVTLVSIAVLVGVVAIPVGIAVGAFMLGKRHLDGRRTRFDGALEGVGRANAMSSHLQAGTPDPDALAVPAPDAGPPPPG